MAEEDGAESDGADAVDDGGDLGSAEQGHDGGRPETIGIKHGGAGQHQDHNGDGQ